MCLPMLRTLLAFSVVAVYQTYATVSCPAVLSGQGYMIGQSCYEFVTKQKTWVNAQIYCHSRVGRMAMLNTGDLQRTLSSKAATIFTGYQGVWLGLNDRKSKGEFVWDNYDSNSQLKDSYYHWQDGEPSDDGLFAQHCVYMRRSYSWRWVVVECNLPRLRSYCSICEYRTVTLTTPRTLPSGLTVSATTPFRATTMVQSPSSSAAPTESLTATTGTLQMPTITSSSVSAPMTATTRKNLPSDAPASGATSSNIHLELVTNSSSTRGILATVMTNTEMWYENANISQSTMAVVYVGMTTHSGFGEAQAEPSQDKVHGTHIESAPVAVSASVMASSESTSATATLHIYLPMAIAVLAVAIVATAIIFHLKHKRRGLGVAVGLENPLYGTPPPR